ncbi:MAG: hypothetical protein JSW39_22270 [Desulfobacterales bacterium]|nr:MAG: hypothetical protein JSW39_22270 [Desulfobacterales bacterium]
MARPPKNSAIHLNCNIILNYLAKKKWNKPELARQSGVSHKYLCTLLNGKSKSIPSEEIVGKIAGALGVEPWEIAEGFEPPLRHPNFEEDKPIPKISGKFPLISWVQAGLLSLGVDLYTPVYAKEWVEAKIGNPNAFALRVKGQSMYPMFLEGDTIVVSPNRTPVSGNYVIAKLFDEKEARLKQLLLYDDKIVLRSLNPIYPEILFAGDERKKLQIVGVVVDLMRRII